MREEAGKRLEGGVTNRMTQGVPGATKLFRMLAMLVGPGTCPRETAQNDTHTHKRKHIKLTKSK